MYSDYLGNRITASHAGTALAIDDFVGGLLAYETRAMHLLAAADADPGNCLANSYAGLLWMFLEAPEAAASAARYLAAAEAAAGHVTRREQLTLAVLRAWHADDIVLALRLSEQALDEFPRDLVQLKLHQYFDFNRGDAAGMLRVARQVERHNADLPHLHGMLAFAYEQGHQLDAAEQAAQRALALQDKEPWAEHALAHVLLTRGRIAEGAEFLEGRQAGWQGLNSFMYTHLWWHLALFYLGQGRGLDALAVYDRHCWGVEKTYSQDQIGAVSLLARLELAGVDVGVRWQALGVYLAARHADTVQPFLTMQYLYGLARAGRPEADQLLQAVRDYGARAPAHSATVWREVALPACEGLLAHARGDAAGAAQLLAAVRPRLISVGGSHAQRDLFDQILLDAFLRSGRWPGAAGLAARRLGDLDPLALRAALKQLPFSSPSP